MAEAMRASWPRMSRLTRLSSTTRTRPGAAWRHARHPLGPCGRAAPPRPSRTRPRPRRCVPPHPRGRRSGLLLEQSGHLRELQRPRRVALLHLRVCACRPSVAGRPRRAPPHRRDLERAVGEVGVHDLDPNVLVVAHRCLRSSSRTVESTTGPSCSDPAVRPLGFGLPLGARRHALERGGQLVRADRLRSRSRSCRRPGTPRGRPPSPSRSSPRSGAAARASARGSGASPRGRPSPASGRPSGRRRTDRARAPRSPRARSPTTSAGSRAVRAAAAASSLVHRVVLGQQDPERVPCGERGVDRAERRPALSTATDEGRAGRRQGVDAARTA